MAKQIIIKDLDNEKAQGLIGRRKIKKENFELVEIEMPKLETEGSVLVQSLWISVDPYLRGLLPKWNNKPATSGQIVKVIESKNKDYPVNTELLGYFIWSDYFILSEDELVTTTKIPPKVNNDDEKVGNVDLSKIPISYYLGALGMPGRTSYYGLIDLGKLNRGNKKKSILVSGAAGAVGSVVGQIAKIHGHYVVGTAGTDDKLKWLKKIGFDEVINYKDYKDTSSCQEALKKVLPNGIDIYFDNTGGIITDSIWDLINVFARIIVCGQITYYDTENISKIDPFLHKLIYKQASIHGLFQVNFKEFDRFYRDMGTWILENKISVEETVIEGFENIPKAFLGLFTGKNTGKMLIKCEK